jgi:hypothetical protein
MVAVALAGAVLAAMTALAVASTTRGPVSAIPAKALASLTPDASTTIRIDKASRMGRHIEIPHSLVGSQLAWLLAEFNGGSATLTQEELKAHLDEHFLLVVPASEVIQFLRRANDLHGPINLIGFAGRPSATATTALIETQAHLRYHLHLAVEADHLIKALSIHEQSTRSGA